MGIGTQLIECMVNECKHHDGNRCQLPRIQVSYCQKDADIHKTRCLSFEECQEMK